MAALTVWTVVVVLTVVVCAAVILAIRKPMCELLESNTTIARTRRFYVRAFAVLVVLAGLTTVTATDIPSDDPAFMEYVWWVAETTQTLFMSLSFWLIGYAALLTLLFVVLGRYRD